MFEYVFSFVYALLYVILCNMFISIFSKKRAGNLVCLFMTQLLMICLNYLVSYLFEDSIIIRQTLIIILNSFFVFFIYEIKIISAVALLVLYHGSCVIVEYLTIVFIQNGFHLHIEDIVEGSIFNFLLTLLCQMIMFCMILILKIYFIGNSSVLLTAKEWARFSVFPIFSLVAIVTMLLNFEVVQNRSQGMVLICIVTGLLIMNIILFALLHDALKREKEIAEYRIIQERSRNKMEMYQSMLDNYDKQRKIVHEFKNHMSCILSLLQRKEYEEAIEYLGKIQKKLLNETNLIDTNHKLINVILNTKYQEAKEKGILFVLKTNDLSGIIIENQDIVILLSNLLNNAFEACEKCMEKIVRFKMVCEEEQIILSVANPYFFEIVKSGERYLTSKSEDAEFHGIGIENIKDVVEKYNGTYVITNNNNYFKFTIIIPNECMTGGA